ncbi:unnamed protein product [Pseudo-nitzschia multistriata]|uniref:J domain-containing protein n=1 Tax=Pseudo-nitzschia multistriata TaxID=183589 RepID=A0A448Z7D4_9STRA|nr:unnamed protein product [Pseudo-nitzschia multistriata]
MRHHKIQAAVRRILRLSFLLGLAFAGTTAAFSAAPPRAPARSGARPSPARLCSTRSGRVAEESFLMKPFQTASGETVNPYRVLKVPRSAERKEIREAYRRISKRYHPDIVRHKDVLPGNCNSHDDVEAEWERIQLSYDILSERKRRMQYDRHELIADPGAAVQRAAFEAAAAGVVGLGKGIFRAGSSALDLLGGAGKRDAGGER